VFFTENPDRAWRTAGNAGYDGRVIRADVPQSLRGRMITSDPDPDYQDVEVPFEMLPEVNNLPAQGYPRTEVFPEGGG
jgi:hypothetical protein